MNKKLLQAIQKVPIIWEKIYCILNNVLLIKLKIKLLELNNLFLIINILYRLVNKEYLNTNGFIRLFKAIYCAHFSILDLRA